MTTTQSRSEVAKMSIFTKSIITKEPGMRKDNEGGMMGISSSGVRSLIVTNNLV